jgi:acyl-coenzyme A thioesterase PaaI-like protein
MWYTQSTVQGLNNRPKNHLSAFLGIEFSEITKNSLSATMPVNEKTHVWDIKIFNDQGKLNCISRLTVAIIAKLENK